MPSTIPILRARRERRLARQRAEESRKRSNLLTVGIIFSLFIAACIFISALSYVYLTRDLPSAGILPILLNPPDGLLLQPTRIYDRTGENILFCLCSDGFPAPLPSAQRDKPSAFTEILAERCRCEV